MPARGSLSIVYRLTALAVAVSLVAFVFNGLLVFQAFDPMFEDLNDSLSGEIAVAHLALTSAAPFARPGVAAQIGRIGLVAYMEDRRSAAANPPDAPEGFNPLLRQIRQRLGPGVTLRMRYPGANALAAPQLVANFDIDGERWALELPMFHGSGRKQVTSLLSALVLAALIPLSALVAGIRLITRPMSRLAQELADRSHRLRPLDMQHATSTEFQEIFLAFNGLVAALGAANAAQHSLLAGVSHDLRTPLARLRLRAEMDCPPATARALEANCDALDRIIGQFTAYAKGEVSVSLGVPEPLPELLRHACAQYKRHHVSLSMDERSAERLAYPDVAIWRIVTNLIDNAIAYGQAPISLQVEVNDTECRLWVSDAGPGIEAGELPNAIKPFVKLRTVASRGLDKELGHCGLGLAIVAQICKELGGRIFQLPFDGKASAVGVSMPLPDATPTRAEIPAAGP